MSGFVVDWCAGPSAQIELSQAIDDAGLTFRYTPPFRATLRPPVTIIPIGSKELRHASQLLRTLTSGPRRGDRDARDVSAPTERVDEIVSDMETLGGLLYDLVIADVARRDLRIANCFVDFGVQESMLHFPWELMHDGEEYVCLKHAFGRFVSGVTASVGPATPVTWLGTNLARVSVLLISVSHPQPRSSTAGAAPYLPAAEREAQQIIDTLSGVDYVDLTVLRGTDATVQAVATALRTNRYHVVHYCGHASYGGDQPTDSALTLWDGDLTAGFVQRLFTRAQPILCVVNACETARLPDERALNLYSLARAFLETGAYLVGSRWRLDDDAASRFAGSFYEALLLRGEPLGEAMRAGRRSARAALDPLAWGAYVLYGDPRLCFRSVDG